MSVNGTGRTPGQRTRSFACRLRMTHEGGHARGAGPPDHSAQHPEPARHTTSLRGVRSLTTIARHV